MKIAIIHGYLLSGTGSNIYVANLAAGLVARGHDVFLFCREPQPEGLQFIDECYDFEADNRRFLPVFNRRGPGPGRVRLFRPRIGDILPVYVLDEYHGFVAREFHGLPAPEIENYVARNAQAVKTVHEAFGLDVVQANHLIAQPAVARRALEGTGVPYHVTIHGSALNYSVRKKPGLNGLALYGLEKAASISASSKFLGKQLNDYLLSVGRPKVRVDVVYPGVELTLFKPVDDRVKSVAGLEKQFGTLRNIDWEHDQIVTLVGRYLAAKGLHACILAAPLVRARQTRARFLAIGSGDEREQFEALVAALAAGDGPLVYDLVREIEKPGSPPIGGSYLDDLKRRGELAGYLEAAKAADLTGTFLFTGPLNHVELARLLPAAALSVSPSIFPEAFGMVAVEALAAGVWPVVTEDFGMAEIAKICRAHLSGRFTPLPKLKLDGRFVDRLGEIISLALADPYLGSRPFKDLAHRLAVERFSWERVVDDFLKLFGRRRRHVA